MKEENSAAPKNPKDKWVPWYFVAFFATIAVIDGTFVYMAVTTQTGTVTDNAYEQGLEYNEILAAAKAQPDIKEKAVFENGVLRWSLADKDGKAIEGAAVTARIKRPVQSGHDFDITLKQEEGGTYSAPLALPLKGRWLAQLSGKWDSKQYRTTLDFTAP